MYRGTGRGQLYRYRGTGRGQLYRYRGTGRVNFTGTVEEYREGLTLRYSGGVQGGVNFTGTVKDWEVLVSKMQRRSPWRD
jgi:hypothetical protein